jgi:predicted exporter
VLVVVAAIATVVVTHRRHWRRTLRELVPMLVAFGR